VFLEQKWTRETDVFSFGVVVFEVFSFGGIPFGQFSNETFVKMLLDPKVALDVVLFAVLRTPTSPEMFVVVCFLFFFSWFLNLIRGFQHFACRSLSFPRPGDAPDLCRSGAVSITQPLASFPAK
jgi:hypothetical protein